MLLPQGSAFMAGHHFSGFICPAMQYQQIPGAGPLSHTLMESARSGRVAHAQLFIGQEGGTALMHAVAYAQFINCEAPEAGDSCGRCFSCIKIHKGIHPDVHYCFPIAKSEHGKDLEDLAGFMPYFRAFLDESPFGTLQDWAGKAGFENRTPIIPIRAIRETINGLTLKAFEAKFKVQIIWLPETMHPAGANAILKLLEEPPEYTVFLLVCSQPELLLPTIVSRTQKVIVPALTVTELADYLKKRFDFGESKAPAIASLAEGSIAAALALSDEKEDDFHLLFLEWERAAYANKVDKLLQMTDAFQAMGKELQKTFLRYCLTRLRGAIALKYGAGITVHLPEKERNDLEKMGAIFTVPLLETQMVLLEEAAYHIDRNASARMVFFDTGLHLAQGFQRSKIMA